MKGSCLCGAVAYEVEPPFRLFQYCHCSRCRKFSGAAHSTYIYVAPEQFKWTKGEANVGRFEKPEAKYFATCFCKTCGSSLPWMVQGGKNLVIPAGTLDEDPEILPQQSIYWESRAHWYIEPGALPRHAQLPPGK